MTQLKWAILLILAVTVIPSVGRAQCEFQQPHRADVFVASLVPAFAPCEQPEWMAGGRIQACEPVATTDDGGWTFDPSNGQGRLELSVTGTEGKGKPGDMLIGLELNGIRQGEESATGRGTLRLRLRLTLDHPQEGDLTLPDTALEIPFDMVEGRASLETSLEVVLAELRHPPGGLRSLPSCFIAEVLHVDVLDENGMLAAPVGLGWYGGRY